MPGDPEPLTPPAAGRPLRLLAGGAAATVVVGFVVGFAIGGRGSGGSGDGLRATGTSAPTTVATTTSSTEPATSTSSAPSSTSSSVTTTTAPTSTTTEPVATTEAPTTTAVVPFPTIPSTVAPVTTVPATFAPSRVVVSYGTDPSGRLVLPRNGTATLVITNEGGLAQQWLVTGTGFSTAGTSQGNLAPGQTVTVTVVAPREELPSSEVSGIISVLGAVNPTIAFVIPAA